MATYYVSQNGSDGADGKSPQTAWATIGKVNRDSCGGDTILFHGGDTFYGGIRVKPGIDPEHRTVIASYGKGKATVSQYKCTNPNAWVECAPGIWSIDMMDTANFTGNTMDPDNNIGFLRVDGRIFGYRRFRMEELVNQWDFYCDSDGGSLVMVRSDGNPATLAVDIRLAPHVGCVAFVDNLEVRDIIFCGTGAHGISGSVRYAHITGCEFHGIGGSRLMGYVNPTTRYGNGIEAWCNSSHLLVENCRFSDVYDVAVTIQGRPAKTSWEDIRFKNNVMWDCTQCFEIWTNGEVPDTGIVDCEFTGNICINSGRNWGYDTRPNKMCSTPLLIYDLCCPRCEVEVSGNTFINPGLALIFKSGGPAGIPETYRLHDNLLYHPVGQPMVYPCGGTEQDYVEFEQRVRAANTVIDSRYC